MRRNNNRYGVQGNHAAGRQGQGKDKAAKRSEAIAARRGDAGSCASGNRHNAIVSVRRRPCIPGPFRI
jgi:hypothetical protein